MSVDSWKNIHKTFIEKYQENPKTIPGKSKRNLIYQEAYQFLKN